MNIHLNNRTFQSLANTDNGEVSAQTIFHYQQEEQLIWATYGGGAIQKGFLIGKIVEDHLEFSYQHLNHDFEIMTGKCTSYPELMDNGKIKLKEIWQWTCKDFSSGESILIEM